MYKEFLSSLSFLKGEAIQEKNLDDFTSLPFLIIGSDKGNRHFKLDDMVASLTDHRRKYRIPMSNIFFSLFYTSMVNKNSFLASIAPFIFKDAIRAINY